MSFNEVTDRLIGRIALAELAEELGCSVGALKQARLDPSSPSYRKPPAGWEEAVARLAKKRGGDLLKLAGELEAGGGGR